MKQGIRYRLSILSGISIFLTFLLIASGNSQNVPEEIYSKVHVYVNTPEQIQSLQEYNIPVDEYTGNLKSGIELVLNQNDVEKLQLTGLPYEVLIADLTTYYRNRRPPTKAEQQQSRRIQLEDNVTGFELGSLGGFYTYDEMALELDSMKMQYPDFITAKSSIGTTLEGRDIWMAKISDNPDVDESATEAAVYYDAMHHAREPAAMAVTIYYMYWLLENYGINPEATYLVNNRELFFVPIVNPDGYVYNQTIAPPPQGGGMWRKNRRDNTGPCYGVDLNRNYSYGYGTSGSSSDPCDETYRGTNAFSEPEAQAVRDFVAVIQPTIGFSTHSVRGAYLNPYGYTNISPEYEIYSEFASDFAATNQYLYGRTGEILSYNSSGTTRDYLHSEGSYCWTPEVGGSDFWPFQSEIMSIVSENVYAMKYLSWVGGAFADFQNFSILGKGYAEAGDTLQIGVSVKNRGLAQYARDVVINVSTDYPEAISLVSSVNLDSIAARQIKDNVNEPIQFVLTGSAAFLDEIPLIISITQEGVESSRDTVIATVGKATVLFQDNAENGTLYWSASGNGQPWDTTFVDFYDGSHSFADSRYGNSSNSASSYLTLNQTVNLSEALFPRLQFWAKWAIEEGYDYARLQISVNNGATWTTLAGQHTQLFQGQPSYFGIKHWVKEEIDLSAYAGQQVKFRFYFDSDFNLVGDGFYFDAFKVLDYTQTPVSIEGAEANLPQKLTLASNYPNPFNPNTTIRYMVPAKYQGAKVSLKIFNSLGQEVRTLVNEAQSAGERQVIWNGTNNQDRPVSSGIYLYRLKVNDEMLIRKMLLLK